MSQHELEPCLCAGCIKMPVSLVKHHKPDRRSREAKGQPLLLPVWKGEMWTHNVCWGKDSAMVCLTSRPAASGERALFRVASLMDKATVLLKTSALRALCWVKKKKKPPQKISKTNQSRSQESPEHKIRLMRPEKRLPSLLPACHRVTWRRLHFLSSVSIFARHLTSGWS